MTNASPYANAANSPEEQVRLAQEYLIFGQRWAESLALEREMGQHVRKRNWRERLLSWPWRPWSKWEIIKQWTPEEVAQMHARLDKIYPNRLVVHPVTHEVEGVIPGQPK